MASLSAFQTLLDAIDLPVWQRGADGALTWVNQAYGEAVEASRSASAVKEGREFLATVARERIRRPARYDAALSRQGFHRGPWQPDILRRGRCEEPGRIGRHRDRRLGCRSCSRGA